MPKVSVIIPVYNAEKYISKTLDSVLRQTMDDLEVICVDDGSTDSSPQILEFFQKRDQRIKIIHQRNGGGSAARNTGIMRAASDYVMFLDSDDLYAMDIVAAAHKRATENKVDIVFYNFARFMGKPTKMAVINKATPKGEALFFTKKTYSKRFFNDFSIITWNKLIKRSVLLDNELLFDTTLSHNHDVDFSIRVMLAAESYSWLNKTGYFYRTNELGLTATKRSDPTNVLRILLDLSNVISAKYSNLKPSFDNYVSDMITGTIMKYSNDPRKLKEVSMFAHSEVLPRIGYKDSSVQDQAAPKLLQMVAAGQFKGVEAYVRSPQVKTKQYMRQVYNFIQSALARFTV
jgi:glycosyltransferase involved in cell wall biosynthesis